ncbi:MAG: Type secretion system protein [Planctomycetota bacterium]|jgi:general secretion pathway protein F/type IV pilus assembly protein PilC
MSQYAYVARDMTGKKVTGVVDAGSPREATAQLSAKNLFPVEIKATDAKAAANKSALTNKKVKGQVMATFYAQLASLLRSGVPMLRSLTVLSQQSTDATLSAVLTEIKGRVEEGEPLGQAMARYPRVFSEMAVNMTRAGAEGGFLEDALERVGTFTELQEDLKGRTISALAYPIFLFGVGTIVITILLVFFVPKFDTMFDRLRSKGQMPWVTDALLAFSRMLQSYGWILVILAVIAFLVFRAKLASEAGREWGDRIKLKIPVLGGILMNLAVARFCRVLGTLLANGVPILKSLDISRSATGNRLLSNSIADAAENIRSGDSLASPLRSSGHFPLTVVEMISVAEESNSLDRVLPEIADSLEKRTFRRLDLFVRLLEPVMLLVMAMLVMLVVLALLVPVIRSSTAL